jgi:hypothetical protein
LFLDSTEDFKSHQDLEQFRKDIIFQRFRH